MSVDRFGNKNWQTVNASAHGGFDLTIGRY
jgi:hypothetical protein